MRTRSQRWPRPSNASRGASARLVGEGRSHLVGPHPSLLIDDRSPIKLAACLVRHPDVVARDLSFLAVVAQLRGDRPRLLQGFCHRGEFDRLVIGNLIAVSDTEKEPHHGAT